MDVSEDIRGIVHSYSKGYGFVTVLASPPPGEQPQRYFFHNTAVVGDAAAVRVGMEVMFSLTTSQHHQEKREATNIRNSNGGAIGFGQPGSVNMAVTAPGRRVGVCEHSTPAFSFVVDQESGERVFVPRPLIPGQQIEFTREDAPRGPKAGNITGQMGAPLDAVPIRGRGRGGPGRGTGGFVPRGNGFGRGR